MGKLSEETVTEIINKYGKGVMVGGDEIVDQEIKTLSVSPALNIILNGGIPEGTWVNLSAKPKWGKTTLALHFAANCQKEENGGREVFYLDIEGRLKKMNLKGIHGLNLKKFHAIKSTKDKILTAQDFLNMGEQIAKTNEQCVIIVDSYSALCSEKEQNDEVGVSTRGQGASGYSLLASFCRKLSNVVPVMRSNVIGIVQLMANTSGYGAGMVEKGGNSIIYQADIRLSAKSMEAWAVNGRQIGQKVTWICQCSALGSPGGSIESYIKYGYGIDEVRELQEFGIAANLILKEGAWYTCVFMKNHLDILSVAKWDASVEKQCKAQGGDALQSLLTENPRWLQALEQEIRKLLS
jgi:recombination protein RecA